MEFVTIIIQRMNRMIMFIALANKVGRVVWGGLGGGGSYFTQELTNIPG